MSDSKRQQQIKRWLLVLLEIALLVAIVYSIHWWRTRNMLADDGLVQAPYFELQDLDGNPWTTDDLKGNPAVLYFFAPWCKVCNASARQLRWFHEWTANEAGLVLVALDYARIADVEQFRTAHRLTMPILLGNAELSGKYSIPGYPTYYVIGSNGAIVDRDFGYTTVLGIWFRTLLAG